MANSIRMASPAKPMATISIVIAGSEMLLVEMLLVESNGRRKSNPGTNPSRFLFIPYQPFNEAAPDGP